MLNAALCRGAQILNVALCRGAQILNVALCRGAQILNVALCRGAQILNVALCRGAQRLRWGGRAESLAQGFGLRLRFWPHIVGLRPILSSSWRKSKRRDNVVMFGPHLTSGSIAV